MAGKEERIDITQPLWDQSSFFGRVRHFAFVTDPTTIFVSDEQLDKAKILYEQYKNHAEPKGTTLKDVIYAKKLYESSFHPDTGEKQNIFGRMSFQVPGGMLITGAMLQFYRTSTAVIFWQWVNQSFNALVNYTNRNAKSPVTTTQLVTAYVSATASALVTALGCKKYLAKKASPLLQRYVPFAAVAAANCVNIPLMRQGELINGIGVTDEKGNKVTESRVAAAKGISQVVSSRIFMAFPGMTILPIIVERIQHQPWFARYPKLHAPFQVLGAGGFLVFMVPIACGLYPQKWYGGTQKYLTRKEKELFYTMKINRRLLPIKLHYFFFMAASGPILPYLTVYGKQLGITEVIMGSITAILPIIFLLAKPFFGFVADYFINRRKLIFILLILSMSLFYESLSFIHPVPYKNHNVLVFNASFLPDCELPISNYNLTISDCPTLEESPCELLKLPSSTANPGCLADYCNCNLTSSCEIRCSEDNPAQFYASFSFYGFVIFMSLAMIAFNVANSVSDAICFDVLGDEGRNLYGKQRVWGAVGFGITALIGGFGMDFYSEKDIKNYTPAFIMVSIFTVFDLLCCSQLRVPKMNQSSSILKDVLRLINHKEIIIFLTFSVLAGILDSFIIYFLFWFLEDLSAETHKTENIKLLEGLTVAAETLGSEILFFPFSGKILNKIGYDNCFSLCFFNYAVRLGLISLIPSPWWILTIEFFMQGPTYALTYTVIVAKTNQISLPGTTATMQGLVAGMDDGLGYAIGSLVGGFLYRAVGGRLAFQYYCLLSIMSCMVHMLTHKFILSKTNKDKMPDAETSQKMIMAKEQEITVL